MRLRETNIAKLSQRPFDVLVVGGGINGAVSLAALSARGARVALIERGDFAGVTSQASSNLAWGGIKYLENYEFGLVRKLSLSRNRLMRAYPSTVQEIRFYVPHEKGFRHGRMKLYLGSWLYWLMGNCHTAAPRLLSNAAIAADEPLVNLEGVDGGFEYSDAYFHDNDARFVFNFVRSALNYGGIAANYVESVQAIRKAEQGLWEVTACDRVVDRSFSIRARVLINACGPLADDHNELAKQPSEHHHVFSKGIHLIVPQMTPHRRVMTFVAEDGRMFFMVPMGPRTCIGTTDTRVAQPTQVVEPEDRAFVLDNANRLLQLPQPLTTDDIIAERCGVRPLVVKGTQQAGGDWTQLSRKHVVEVQPEAQYLTIFGGKLTDCLNVGDEVCRVVRKLGVSLPHRRAKWYGEPHDSVKHEFLHQAELMELDRSTPASSSEPLTSRLWRRYGAQAIGLLENMREDPQMAELLIENAEYLRCEIEQAARREMITKLADFLHRRSKIALVVSREALLESSGLLKACEIMFGEQARQEYDAYFRERCS
jgi:glycerol-3-phosphate dehydrogenase